MAGEAGEASDLALFIINDVLASSVYLVSGGYARIRPVTWTDLALIPVGWLVLFTLDYVVRELCRKWLHPGELRRWIAEGRYPSAPSELSAALPYNLRRLAALATKEGEGGGGLDEGGGGPDGRAPGVVWHHPRAMLSGGRPARNDVGTLEHVARSGSAAWCRRTRAPARGPRPAPRKSRGSC